MHLSILPPCPEYFAPLHQYHSISSSTSNAKKEEDQESRRGRTNPIFLLEESDHGTESLYLGQGREEIEGFNPFPLLFLLW